VALGDADEIDLVARVLASDSILMPSA